MTKTAGDLPPRKRPLITPYRAAWFVLGALGLGYLGIAMLAPGWLGDLTPVTDRQRDVADMRSSLTKLQLDVSTIKADLAAQTARSQALETQVSALEDKIRLGQTSISSAAEPAVQAAAQNEKANVSADATQTPTPAAPAKTGANAPKIINSEKAQPIVTGSVDGVASGSPSANTGTDAIDFGPPVVKPAAKPIGIQIGSGPSIDGLRTSWNQLSEHSDKLKKLTARYTDNGDALNPNFSLIAGPLKSKAEAARICKELATQSVACKVGEFKGEAL